MCVTELGTGKIAAYFGTANEEGEPYTEPVGDDNMFTTGPTDRGQPTQFAPGSSGKWPEGAFIVQFPKDETLTWRLGSREVTASIESNPCRKDPVYAKYDPAQYVAPKKPKPKPPEPKPKPPEPKPPEPKPPEPKPPEPKPPEPPPKAVDKPDVKKEATRKPKNYIKKKGQPKRKKKRAPKKKKTVTKKNEPAPLVLSGLTNLGKGVNIQSGDDDILGNASITATDSNTNVERVDDPKSVPDKIGDGTGGSKTGVKGGTGKTDKPPKRVAAKIRKRVKGAYPSDAPKLGRKVIVVLSLTVGSNGRVKSARIVRSAGKAFDRAAKKYAKKLIFYPAKIGSKKIESKVPWTFEFTPDDF